jgi:hypothetical protein
MKIDPPSISVNSNSRQANTTTSQGASQSSRLPQLDQLLRQIAPSGQKTVTAIVQANSLPLSKAEQAHSAAQSGLYQVLLKVGNKEFSANSPIPLLKGQKVELEINPARGLAIRAISIDKNNLINDALKLLTPKQENLSQLFTLLSQQSLKLQDPGNKQEASIQQQLEKAITRLLNHPPRTHTLQNPQQMQQTLKQSGIFHENQLKQVSTKQKPNVRYAAQPNALTSNPDSNPDTNRIQQDLKSQLKNFERQLQQLKQDLAKVSQPSGKTKNTASSDKNTHATKQGITAKAELNTSGQIKGETKTSAPADSKNTALQNATKNPAKIFNPPPPPGAKQLAQVGTLPPALRNTLYFQSANPVLNSNPSATTGSRRGNILVKESTEKVIEALIRQTSSALAKIQLNQISSLNQPASPSAETATAQQWLFEIPVNTGSQVETVSILIKEEEEKKAENDNEKEKRWFVNLSFDLEEFGKLQVELTLVGESASSTIWVEQGNTYENISPQLSNLQTRLEALGLNVEKLDCRKGLPPQQKTGIHSQLIDINT